MLKRFTLAALVASSCFALLPRSALSHHGSNGQFDQSKSIKVSGVVTNIKFVNPHSYIYFDVSNEAGGVDEWRCELRAASIHKRYGWTKDIFETGAQITIEGSPAWREPQGCFTRTITFTDGTILKREDKVGDDGAVIAAPRALKMANGTPNLSGTWVAPPRGPRASPTRNPNVPPPVQMMGAPEPALPPAGDDLPYKVTEDGLKALSGVTDQDNPRFQCKPVNIIQDWVFDQNINSISQYDDVIILNYGLMDLTRTIHMNEKSHPKDIPLSRAGYSIGHWEKGVLVIDTFGFEPGFLLTGGSGMIKHTDQLNIKERFTMSEDGQTITREYEATDPKYISGVYRGSDKMGYTTSPYNLYDCEDLTEEIVSGF